MSGRPLLSDKPTEIAKRALRSARQAQAISIVALILGFGIAVGYGVWVGLRTTNLQNTIQNNAVEINNLHQELMMTQAEFLEALQNFNGTELMEFTIQTGTVRWELGSVDFDPTEPFITAGFLNANLYASVSDVPYEVRVRQINGLNFTYLILSPPTSVLDMSGAFFGPDTTDFLGVRILAFTPTIFELNQLGNSQVTMPLTPSNVARLSITPDCTTLLGGPPGPPGMRKRQADPDSECFQTSSETDSTLYPPLQNGIKVSYLSNEYENAIISYGYQGNANFNIQWDKNGIFGAAAQVTISESLDILLPLSTTLL